MNEQEFLNQYMSESGIFEQSRAFGRRKAEEDIVEDYFKHTGTDESHIQTIFEKKTKNINNLEMKPLLLNLEKDFLKCMIDIKM